MNELTRPPDTYPEDIRDTFEYCEDCGKLVVSIDQHTCPTGSSKSRKSAAERAQLAALDDRPRDDDVVIPKGGSENNAWAYHELEGGETLHETTFDAGQEIGTRKEAINKGCFPCGTCRLIQARNEDGEGDG